MKEIGELLKQKRLEKGMTIDQIAEKTKMPAVRIKALEEGNISVFKDDLTYLQFFLQAYCNAVGISYQEIKGKLNDSINSYTTNFEKDKLKEQEASEKKIRANVKKKHGEDKGRKNVKVRRKVDFSLITFIVVIAIAAVCCLSVGGYYLAQRFISHDPEPVVPPVVETPPAKPESKPQDEEPEPPKEEPMSVTAVDANHYAVENVKDKVILKIEFHANSWLQATLDDAVMSDPAAKIYNSGSQLEIEIDPAKNKTLLLHFGYFAKTKMFVDDIEVEIDPSIANTPGVVDVTFSFGGIADEPAE